MHQRSFSVQPYRVSSCRLISTRRHTPVKCCAGVGNKSGFLRRHVLPLFRASVEPRISVIRAYRCLPPSTRYTKLCSIQSLNSGRSVLVSRQLSVAAVISTQELKLETVVTEDKIVTEVHKYYLRIWNIEYLHSTNEGIEYE